MSYRAAVIGCGAIGSALSQDPLAKGICTHAAAYQSCPDTQIVGLCDSNLAQAKASAARWEVSYFTDSAEALLREQKPDIVSICTPNASHGPLLRLALGFPSVQGILMEKPLALDLKEGGDLVKQARDQGVTLAVNYSRRFSSGHQRLRDLVRSEPFGQIQRVAGYYTKGIFHNGTHWIDLARWLVGEIESVHGLSLSNWDGTDGRVDAHFEFAGGSRGTLQSLNADAFTLFEMDIVGTGGRARVFDSGYRVEVSKVGDSPHFTGYRALISPFVEDVDMSDTLLGAVSDLVFCLKNGRVPLCSGADGLRAIEVAAACLDSANRGKPVRLSGAGK